MQVVTRSVLFVCLAVVAPSVGGECPSMDFTGDCFVDMADFALFMEQWLTGETVEDDMVLIPGGTFRMGDAFAQKTDELPVHSVTLSEFYMGRYEVTNGEYCEFLNWALSEGVIMLNQRGEVRKAGSPEGPLYCATSTSWYMAAIGFEDGEFLVYPKLNGRGMSDDPAVGISWYGAAAYCNWRSEQEGREPCYAGDDPLLWECDRNKNGYRLPTEAQWEYAARGGLQDRRFPWGDTIDHSRANYVANGVFYTYDTSPTTTWTYHPTWNDGFEPYTCPVGRFPANGYGLYDLIGNVWEWCNDRFAPYASAAQNDPTGPATGNFRVTRGGSWLNVADSCRVSYRSAQAPGASGYTSFRLCR